MPMNNSVRLIPSVSLTYADVTYAQVFYGVDVDAAAASSLDISRASASIESAQVALVAVRNLNDRWSVTGIAALSILQDDSADSHVTLVGDDKQLFTTVVAKYPF